ncbi:hypothetical protein M758_UG255200 [Ceratodon purpureus]|nr:hypothetical protein M758_UG255200 [Ceratodon purpureus]
MRFCIVQRLSWIAGIIQDTSEADYPPAEGIITCRNVAKVDSVQASTRLGERKSSRLPPNGGERLIPTLSAMACRGFALVRLDVTNMVLVERMCIRQLIHEALVVVE